MEILVNKLYNSSSFQTIWKEILRDSVRLGFANLIATDTDYNNVQIDFGNILSQASILQKSDEFIHLDAALRIAQYVISHADSSKAHKVAATVIFEGLTNKPAIKLALDRKYIDEAYLESVPLPLRLEMTQRDIEYSILTKDDKIISLNRFQKKVYESYQNYDLISISAPTSAGKSFILERILLEELTSKRDDVVNVIFLVPTRALISQVEQELKDMFIENELNDVFISSVPQFTSEFQNHKNRVLIFTQERLHWFKSETPDFQVDVMIVDEAHKINDGSRGILLQQKLEEQFASQNKKGKVYFSSPFTSNPETLLDIFPNSNSKAPIKTEFVSVNQNLIFVSQRKSKPLIWDVNLATKDSLLPLGEINLKFRPDKESKKLVFVVYELGDPEGGNIIYANGPADAEKFALILFDLLSEKKFAKDDEIEEFIKLVQKSVHKSYALAKVIRRGIAFHYGNMPLIIRSEIERLFKNNKIKYLFCTSTLLEGVNLPAKSIFIKKPTRGNNKPMNASDFWNLAGRAGRWGKEFQGNVICVEPNKWKNPPNVNRDKLTIQKAVDELANKKTDLIKFIQDGSPRLGLSNNIHLEYGFTYHYSKFLKDEMNLSNPFELELRGVFLEIQNQIKLPASILLRNPGISPLAQQNLFEYFDSYFGDDSDLIPELPESEDAATNSYQRIIQAINTHLSGDPEVLSIYQAILVVNWMNGHPLSKLIDNSYDYWIRRNQPRKIDRVIRDTMRDVEEFARFKFAKYSGCYVDILRWHFRQSNKIELIEEIPDLNIWLEFGVSQQTQVSLIGLGLSRSTAITISEFIANDSLNRTECISWLKENDIYRMNISPIMIAEIEKAILKVTL